MERPNQEGVTDAEAVGVSGSRVEDVELPEYFIETFAKVRVIQNAADTVANKPGTRVFHQSFG